MAGAVAFQRYRKGTFSPGIGIQVPGVIAHGRDRDTALQNCSVTDEIRLSEGGPHLGQVCQGMSQAVSGNLQAEIIIGLQQAAPGHHQALPHRPVGSLAEVSALGMLFMGPAPYDRDLHIRDLGAGQDASVPSFLQVGHDQALPVPGQFIDAAAGFEHKAAAGFAGLQQQMNLRVVTQGLKVSYAFHRCLDGLFINNAGRAEADGQFEAFPGRSLQHFPLHFTHDLGRDLLLVFIVYDVQDRILFLQQAQVPVGLKFILRGRQDNLAADDRLQQAFVPVFFHADALARIGSGQTCHGAYLTSLRLSGRREFVSGINTDLVRLLADLFASDIHGQHGLDFKRTAGDLHPCQTAAAFIPCDLVDSGPEFLFPFRFCHETVHGLHQAVHMDIL